MYIASKPDDNSRINTLNPTQKKYLRLQALLKERYIEPSSYEQPDSNAKFILDYSTYGIALHNTASETGRSIRAHTNKLVSNGGGEKRDAYHLDYIVAREVNILTVLIRACPRKQTIKFLSRL